MEGSEADSRGSEQETIVALAEQILSLRDRRPIHLVRLSPIWTSYKRKSI